MNTKILGCIGVVYCCMIFSIQAQEVDVNTLAQQWYLEKYEVFGSSYLPETIEKQDYIFLKEDNTYTSVSEGIYAKGLWSIDHKGKRIVMKDTPNQETITFKIKSLSSKALVLVIDEEDDITVKYLKIHLKNNL